MKSSRGSPTCVRVCIEWALGVCGSEVRRRPRGEVRAREDRGRRRPAVPDTPARVWVGARVRVRRMCVGGGASVCSNGFTLPLLVHRRSTRAMPTHSPCARDHTRHTPPHCFLALSLALPLARALSRSLTHPPPHTHTRTRSRPHCRGWVGRRRRTYSVTAVPCVGGGRRWAASARGGAAKTEGVEKGTGLGRLYEICPGDAKNVRSGCP